MKLVTELIVAALPVLRRGGAAALVGSCLAFVLAITLCFGVGFTLHALLPYDQRDGLTVIVELLLSPVCLGLLAAGSAPAFALALDGPVGVGRGLVAGLRSLPRLVLVAIPGLLGLGTFGTGTFAAVATAAFGPRSAVITTGVFVAIIAILLFLVLGSASIWIRTFTAPGAAMLVENVGFFEGFRRSDAVIAKRRSLLTVSVLLPLVPLLVTLPDSIAARSVASFGISPAPLMAIRGFVGVLAFFATGLLSALFPIVAYALAVEKPGVRPPPEEAIG